MGEHSESVLRRVEVEVQVKDLIQKFPALVTEFEESRVWIGIPGHERELSVDFSDDWELRTSEWHGHYTTCVEAFETALQVLCGAARTSNEFRGDRMASSWLEVWDGNAYEAKNQAIYLNPFDEEDWLLWPGEIWKVKRIHRRFVDWTIYRDDPLPDEKHLPEVGGLGSFEVEADEPCLPPSNSLWQRWDDELGPAQPGLRWVNDIHYKLVMQIPRGWRQQSQHEEEFPHVLFAPEEDHPVVRIFTNFRESDNITPPELKPKEPASIDYKFDAEGPDLLDWVLHEWTIEFHGNEESMRTDIHLYVWKEADPATNDWFRVIDAALGKSRYLE